MELTLERREQADETGAVSVGDATALFTPPISEDYWEYRVMVADGQAVIGFPKFFTIGIGFAVEDYDWNTNLPYTVEAEDILRHIWKNRGDNLPDNDESLDKVLAAIKMIQDAATADRS